MYDEIPFLFIDLFYVLIGTFLIAILERKVVHWLFSQQLKPRYIVAGNYAATIAGGAVTSIITTRLGINFMISHSSPHLYGYTVTFFLYYFFIALLIKYPFYFWSFEKDERDRVKALAYCVYGNLFSCVLVCGLYLFYEFMYF